MKCALVAESLKEDSHQLGQQQSLVLEQLMSLEKITEQQLEFPFLDKIRNQLYAEKQREEMKSLWSLSYRYDGDFGKEMKLSEFVSEIWIKGGMAAHFREKYHKVYFYDS